MIIKSSTKLVEDYEGFSKLAHETDGPIYITKDGEGDLVLMSLEHYEAICRTGLSSEDKGINNEITREEMTVTEYTERKLGMVLGELYENAPRGMQVANLHAFAVYYADVITRERLGKKEIVLAAGLPETFKTELNKGINLAQYVAPNEAFTRRIQEIEERLKDRL